MQIPTSGPAVASDPGPRPSKPLRGAYFALVVLFCMNLLNYVDRYIFAAVGPSIRRDLGASSPPPRKTPAPPATPPGKASPGPGTAGSGAEGGIFDEPEIGVLSYRRYGYLASAFMVVYTLASPVIGWLGDRYSRRRLIAFGVGLWSVATVGTAFAQDYWPMFFWRALLGVGEASYGVVAPTLLADLFPPRLRGRVIGLYSLALPIGGALGYVLGGWIDSIPGLGWRAAFLVVGVPGLFAAVAGLLIHDPGRGASEGLAPAGRADRPQLRDYLELFRTPSFLYNTAGMAAVTFATGAFAMWGPTFYNEVRRMDLKQANIWIGGLTAVAGLLGIALGIWLADWLLKWTRRAYMVWSALAVGLALPFGLFGILDHDRRTSMGLIFLAMVLLASVLGPSNTVTANVVPANRRAAGFAMNIFLIHLFGDITSPSLIGNLADWFGRPEIAASPIGQFLRLIRARPRQQTNLTAGMLSVIPVLALGVFFFLLGSRHLAADQERARKASGGQPAGDVPMH